jgi:hypothetical protein
MVQASDYSDLWMSPYIAITRMKTVSETHGTERASADGRFKKEREGWTTAIFALALSKLSNDEWWIEITTEDTPDARLHQIDQSSGRNVIRTRSVEVVDWEENVDDIMEVIRKKCELGGYPGHYILLVHARHRGKLLDFDSVVDQMKSIKSPFLEVWVVASIGAGYVRAMRMETNGPAIDLELRIELEQAQKQTPFLKRGKRGTSTEFQDLGPAYLPIP